MFDTLDQWLHYIETLHPKYIDMSLSRVAQLSDYLSIRQFKCPVIVVGGTNGKGSCVTCLESIYSEAQFLTGAYTSPHILQFNERIRINQKPVSDQILLSAFRFIEEKRCALNLTLSFFEFTTLAALWIFQNAHLEVLILEVGLGGRLDAVNIVDADAAIISSIALDHVEWLGHTRELIAIEKMGIARSNRPLICADKNPPNIIAKLARERSILLYQAGVDFFYTEDNANLYWKFDRTQLCFTDLPRLKMQNIAAVLMTVHCLQKQLPVSERELALGVAKSKIPGRFEVFEAPLPMVLDVAHNSHAMFWLTEQLTRYFPTDRFIAVFGMLKDKDVQRSIVPLLNFVSQWYTIQLQTERALDAESIATLLRAEGANVCGLFSSVSNALELILKQYEIQKTFDRILICGSFYMVSEAKMWLIEKGY